MINDLSLPCTLVVCGATASGKSHLVDKLLRTQFAPQSDYLYFLSPTLHLTKDYASFPDNGESVRRFHDPSVFKRVVDETVEQCERIRSSSAVDPKDYPLITIVIDDCVGLPILRFRGYVDALSTKSRHLGISLIILVQRHSACPRTLRLNARYFIAFNQCNLSELERFVHELVPKTLQKPMRGMISEIYNEPYSFILVNCFANRIRDRMWLNGMEPLYDLLMERGKPN